MRKKESSINNNIPPVLCPFLCKRRLMFPYNYSQTLISLTRFAKLITTTYVQALIRARFLLIHIKMLQKALIMIVTPYM